MSQPLHGKSDGARLLRESGPDLPQVRGARLEARDAARDEVGGEARTAQVHALVIEILGALMRSPLDGMDAAIQDALARMAQFCDLDRAYVFRHRSANGAEVIDNTHEYCAPGVAPSRHLSRDLPAGLIAPWRSRLDADASVDVPDVAALPEDEPAKAHLERQGVRSLLVVPMRAEGRYSGFIGFDAVRAPRAFAPDEVLLLKAVADAIGTLLARADAAVEIARSQASLADANSRLVSTLRALPDLIIELDADGRHTAVHIDDASEMIVDPAAVIGRTAEEVLPPDMAALNRRAIAEVNATGHFGPHAFTVDMPRQGRRHCELIATPRPSFRPDEEPGYVFLIRDVTAQRRLQREAERLSLIARRMTDLVLVMDLDNRIEWVNPAFEARTGWTLDEIRGRHPPEILNAPGTDLAEVARVGAAIGAGQPVRSEMLSQTRWGEEFWTAIDIQPLHDEDGALSGFVSIETDITAQKAQAAALQKLAAEATEARARLEMAVEALPDAFASFDAANRMVLCNERYRALDPETSALMESGAGFSAAAPEGTERRTADGRWLRMIERSTPEGGRVCMAIDISELRGIQQRLVDIIEGAEIGTWEWNVPSGANVINDRWAEIVGYTLDELAPLTIDVWRRLVHPEDLVAAEAVVARVFAQKEDQFEYQLRMRHKAGHWVRVMSRGRVSRWAADGTPEMMSGVHIDITALKEAEERVAQIIDAAMVGTWEYDYAEGQKSVNDHWARMLGYTRDEVAALPGFGFRELAHADDLRKLDELHDDWLARGESHFTNEIRMRHRSGHWVWILSRGQVVAWDEEGQPLRSAGIHVDISERKQLEAQLTAERDYLTRLMETSGSGIAALDAKGQIIFANREAERILGLSASVIVGRSHDAPEWQITHLDGRPASLEDLPFTRVMQTGETVRDVRLAIAWPDGTRRMMSLNAAPISGEGLDVRMVCSINDITEQVAAERELRSAAERAEAANQAKSRFLANMSHEIRTPLNGVLGMAQVLEEELTEPRHQRILGIIRESGEMLLGVLNDILDMSKIEAGKLTLEEVDFDLTALAARIEALHRPKALDKGLAFELRLDPAARGPRRGDPSRLSQILHNLIGNAVKFTETGAVTVTMEGGTDGGLAIRVRDTGIGMTEDQLARVFVDFEQADGTVTRRFGGTGLGMSIVRRLVELMGGEIAIDSAPGRGTEVRLCLPLPRVQAGAAEAAAPPPAPRPGALAGLRVLAADDNVTNRLILKALLSRLGVEADLVGDGRAALDAWAPGRYDVILLDISMPVLDGISALTELRAREAAEGVPPTPALAITANALSHQVAEYLEAGFAAHLGKPLRREDLIATLAAVAPPAEARPPRPAPAAGAADPDAPSD